MAKFTIFDGCCPTKFTMNATFCQFNIEYPKSTAEFHKSRLSFLPLNVANAQQIVATKNIKTIKFNIYMKFIAIIPARYASTRFPGKPLALISGKPMVQHVYERCKELLEHVYIATDDDRIAQVVRSFGGSYIITDANHPSGTDRVAEAARIVEKTIDFDVVINVQGDEPFLNRTQIEQLMHCFENPKTDIATLVTPINSTSILTDPNKVKAAVASNGRALYFSRSPIPFIRDSKMEEWLEKQAHFLHLGLYAYRAQVLQEVTLLQPSPLENLEKLEQLRWLENGFVIQTAATSHENFGVDTPEDLNRLNEMLSNSAAI